MTVAVVNAVVVCPEGKPGVYRGWGLKLWSDLWDNGGVEGLVWSGEVEAYFQ